MIPGGRCDISKWLRAKLTSRVLSRCAPECFNCLYDVKKQQIGVRSRAALLSYLRHFSHSTYGITVCTNPVDGATKIIYGFETFSQSKSFITTLNSDPRVFTGVNLRWIYVKLSCVGHLLGNKYGRRDTKIEKTQTRTGARTSSWPHIYHTDMRLDVL